MLKNTISSIVVGVVLAALSFYVFVREPTRPTDGLIIEYKSSSLPNSIFLRVIREAIKDTDVPLNKVLDNYKGFLTSRDEFALVEYQLNNDNDHSVGPIIARLNSIIFGIIEDKDGVRIIESDTKLTNLSLLPKSNATMWLVMNYSYHTPKELFLIDGFNISISGEHTNDNILEYWILKDYPIISISLLILGTAFVGAFLIAGFIGIAFGSTPKFILYLSSNDEIARSISLINYLREADEERYKIIVRKSERQVARWRKQSSD